MIKSLGFKFRYSEKATKFEKISQSYLKLLSIIKTNCDIFKNFLALSEYLNFKKFMVEESAVKKYRVEAWDWKFWGWKVQGWKVQGWKVQGWKVWGWKPPVYQDTKAGLNLTVQVGSTLCMSYSNEEWAFQSYRLFKIHMIKFVKVAKKQQVWLGKVWIF